MATDTGDVRPATDTPATLSDEQMAEYVREHRCYNARSGVSIADWDRGIKQIEREASASAATALLNDDQSYLAVGVEVVVLAAGKQRHGLVVQMGDEETRPGCVLVYAGPDSEYPAWWNAEYVIPRAALAAQPAAGSAEPESDADDAPCGCGAIGVSPHTNAQHYGTARVARTEESAT